MRKVPIKIVAGWDYTEIRLAAIDSQNIICCLEHITRLYFRQREFERGILMLIDGPLQYWCM